MEYKTVEYNGLTKETVERNSTFDEIEVIKNLQAKAEARKAEAEAKATAKAELLERLGITADEAKLLLA